jgi:rubrerythrin
MRIIKCLAKQMCGEIESVKKYAINALEYRKSDPELAKLYHELAEIEYDHANRLHEQAVQKIKEIEETGTSIPSFMKSKWDEAHGKMIAKAEEAKKFMDMW